MATKYILDPSGDIIAVLPVQVINPATGELLTDDEGNPVLESKTKRVSVDAYLSTALEGQNANVNEDNINTEGIGLLPGSSLDPEDSGYILRQSNNDPSFNFMSNQETSNSRESYIPFNSFLDKEDKMPRSFADEFEMLAGMRFRQTTGVGDLGDDQGEILGLLFVYLAESLVRIATVEAIVAVNQAIVSPDRNETYETYNLILGKYDFDEYDIFTKYVFNVLNYPHEKSTIDERIAAYFLGFSAWLSPDMLVDLNKLINNNTDSANGIQFASDNAITSLPLIGSIGREATLIINTSLTALAEVAVSTLTNRTSTNRVKLLLRKFYQEKHWNTKVLNSAKDSNPTLDFFADLNYYYFKFYIERVHVGLKLLDRYYDNLTYMDPREVESPLTRVSANRTNNKVSDIKYKFFGGNFKNFNDISFVDSNKNENYAWNYEDSDNSNSTNGGQTTRIRALPQALNMNHSFYKALALNNNAIFEVNSSILQNFYTSDDRRLPQELVVEIENYLESEYMPFYFHDLRTNEILSFHAFIENISDSFTPDYNAASGFGRIDDVRSYVKTTRSISLTFMLAATSEVDHDLMWYQINKIVSMCYPQWSDAFSVETKDAQGNILAGKFKYPFTQVPTASPLIRLRVGDVIKSNYSRGNLSRLHGIGDREGLDKDFGLFDLSDQETARKKSEEATAQALKNSASQRTSEKEQQIAEIERKFGLDRANRQLKLQNELKSLDASLKKRLSSTKAIIKKNESELDQNLASRDFIASNYNIDTGNAALFKGTEFENDTEKSFNLFNDEANKNYTTIKSKQALLRNLKRGNKAAKIRAEAAALSAQEDADVKKDADVGQAKKDFTEGSALDKARIKKQNEDNKKNLKEAFKIIPTCYLLPGIYKTAGNNRAINILNQTDIIECSLEKDEDVQIAIILYKGEKYSLFVDTNRIVSQSSIRIIDTGINLSTSKSDANDILSPTKTVGEGKESVTVSNNPITRAYESGMSRGLAGFITNLDVSYNESTWETTRIGSKAPIMVKLSVAFTPIHDIPPGLDHNGMMRAPVYNVGRLNNEFFGDPHDGYGTYDNETGKLNSKYYQGAGRDAAMQKYNQIFNANKKK